VARPADGAGRPAAPTLPTPAGPAATGAHRPESAGEHMVVRVVRARATETVGSVLARFAREAPEHGDAVYVVDAEGRLGGSVPLAGLLGAEPGTELGALARSAAARVRNDADQEHVASLALRHGVEAVPVVDGAGRLLGVVPPLAILGVLRREHVEDLHRLAGIGREAAQARQALEEPPLRRVRDRLPWLLIGLAGSSVATAVMSRYEAVLADRVAVAFFVPAIVYMADAIGTQTEAVAVRGLSLSFAPLRKLLWGELRTGLLIGLLVSALSFPAVLLGFADPVLAAAVALAVLAAGALATTVGLVFPWALHRRGLDPAFGSGPLATVVQDVLSLLVYLAVCAALL
jgi:magnesium transporter